MEKNTVLLSLKDYNDLRDFKKNITEGNLYVVHGLDSLGSFTTNRTQIYTPKCEIITALKDKIYFLEKRESKRVLEKRDVATDKKQELMQYFSEMSIREFRSFKRKFKKEAK